MNVTPEQLEFIVQEVIRRLRAQGIQTTSEPDTKTATGAKHEPAPVRLTEIDDRLITTHTLEGRLAGVERLQIPARAVVTPAAKDMLRDHGIAWERRSSSP